jgi:hypothetical protein
LNRPNSATNKAADRGVRLESRLDHFPDHALAFADLSIRFLIPIPTRFIAFLPLRCAAGAMNG